MKEDIISILTNFVIALLITTGILTACLMKSLRAESAFRASERQAWEQVHELRSTMASQGMGELF